MGTLVAMVMVMTFKAHGYGTCCPARRTENCGARTLRGGERGSLSPGTGAIYVPLADIVTAGDSWTNRGFVSTNESR
jgi:hypothetical protein